MVVVRTVLVKPLPNVLRLLTLAMVDCRDLGYAVVIYGCLAERLVGSLEQSVLLPRLFLSV